jgi:hypothetical protein
MDHITRSIETLVSKVKEQEAEVWKTKTAVNALRAVLNMPPLYSEPTSEAATVGLANLRGDEFYGKTLSGVVRSILESRKAADQGPATVNEIYSTMIAGGYLFETIDIDNAKRGLRISLTKNSQTFHKLPNGKYGLKEWFPGLKDKPKTAVPAGEKDDEDDDGFNFETKEKADAEVAVA